MKCKVAKLGLHRENHLEEDRIFSYAVKSLQLTLGLGGVDGETLGAAHLQRGRQTIADLWSAQERLTSTHIIAVGACRSLPLDCLHDTLIYPGVCRLLVADVFCANAVSHRLLNGVVD